MNILKKRWPILLILPLALLIGSSIALVSAANIKKEPTTLQVHRMNLIPLNHYLPFSPRIITDQQSVQRLYNAAQALPTRPPGPRSCPVDTGLEYQLDFFQKSTLVQEITIDMGGCQFIHFGKQDVRIYDRGFRQLFAQVSRNIRKRSGPFPPIFLHPSLSLPFSHTLNIILLLISGIGGVVLDAACEKVDVI